MNWGNKLLLSFLVFGSMMGYLVYRSMHTDFELVEKEYYKSELQYQQVIDGSQAASKLQSSARLSYDEDQLALILPEEMKAFNCQGKLLFYCAYNSDLDRNFTFSTTAGDNRAVLPVEKLQPGTYTVKMNWTANEVSYYAEKKFTLNK